jgi:hypothetical protein
MYKTLAVEEACGPCDTYKYYRICSYILNFGSTNGKGSSHDAWSLQAERSVSFHLVVIHALQ